METFMSAAFKKKKEKKNGTATRETETDQRRKI